MGDFKRILAQIIEGKDLARMQTFTQSEFSKKGSADLPQRVTSARYGDNPLEEEEPLDEEDEASDPHLMRLHQELNGIGISDDQIIAGVSLSKQGIDILAREFGFAPEDADKQVNLLIQRLRSALDEKTPSPFDIQEGVDSDRFSCESDSLNNVTIRDNRTGKEHYLQGTDATALLAKLKAHPEREQELLAPYEQMMGLTEAEEVTGGYADEINSNSGSYNTKWKLGKEWGFMTVGYSMSGGKPALKLVSFMDHDGNDLALPGGEKKAEIMKQALAAIGKV